MLQLMVVVLEDREAVPKMMLDLVMMKVQERRDKEMMVEIIIQQAAEAAEEPVPLALMEVQTLEEMEVLVQLLQLQDAR